MILSELTDLQLTARKTKNTKVIPFLSLLISQIQMVGKNDGGRESTNDEAIRVIKKLIGANEETLSNTTSPEKRDALIGELEIMKPFLPSMVSDDEIKKTISDLINNGSNNIGAIMGGLKKQFGSSVDMKLASQLAKSALL